MGLVVTLRNGSEITFDEQGTISENSPDVGTLQDVARKPNIFSNTEEKLVKALSNIEIVISSIHDAVKNIQATPDNIEIEFGVSLKGDCKLHVVNAGTSAHIKVRMQWKNS